MIPKFVGTPDEERREKKIFTRTSKNVQDSEHTGSPQFAVSQTTTEKTRGKVLDDFKLMILGQRSLQRVRPLSKFDRNTEPDLLKGPRELFKFSADCLIFV